MTPAALSMTWTDEELVARSVAGDKESFNQLVRRWEHPIFALAYRVLGRDEDARDVCQETFLRAFRALPGFKGEAKFSSWLYRIALNLCRDWIRRERRAPLVAVPAGVDIEDLAAERHQTASVEDLAARAELSREVAAAMELLPREQRTAIILKEYHGLTFQEIADLMNCPLSTAKTRLYQGLTFLRRQLSGGPQPGPHARQPRVGPERGSRVGDPEQGRFEQPPAAIRGDAAPFSSQAARSPAALDPFGELKVDGGPSRTVDGLKPSRPSALREPQGRPEPGRETAGSGRPELVEGRAGRGTNVQES